MSHNILITGASGYLGGTLLARWKEAKLPTFDKLFALVRTEDQASSVRNYGAQPLFVNFGDEAATAEAIVDNNITIVYYLIDAINSETQVHIIKALAKVRHQTGQGVHFLHTSGAKIFSSHAGFPTDHEILDTDSKLYDIQKDAQSPHELMRKATSTNTIVTDTANALGVRSYVFIPCIVYGKGEGFGNKTSIQTVAIIKAARSVGAVYKVDHGRPHWPVCHITDNTTLYLEILRNILSDVPIGYGKQGYYLASSGSVAWDDIYSAIATSLVDRKVFGHASVNQADEAALTRMGEALGCPKELVPVQVGGRCDLVADRGRTIDWKPDYPPEHILEAADAEVELVLRGLET